MGWSEILYFCYCLLNLFLIYILFIWTNADVRLKHTLSIAFVDLGAQQKGYSYDMANSFLLSLTVAWYTINTYLCIFNTVSKLKNLPTLFIASHTALTHTQITWGHWNL